MGGWLVLGLVYKKAGKVDQARKTWEEGARRLEAKLAAIENVRTRIWLGGIYAELGEKENALRHAGRALADNPNDPWALYQNSLIHARLGRYRSAIDYLKQAVASGFLSIHYVKLDQRPDGALYGSARGPGVPGRARCARTESRPVERAILIQTPCRIMSAAFSAIIITAALVWPVICVGIMEASTTLKPSRPRTRRLLSTTAIESAPILHVPTG